MSCNSDSEPDPDKTKEDNDAEVEFFLRKKQMSSRHY